MESGPKLCYRDDAIIDEAVGLAMGLVMMGTNDLSAIEEMARYATVNAIDNQVNKFFPPENYLREIFLIFFRNVEMPALEL